MLTYLQRIERFLKEAEKYKLYFDSSAIIEPGDYYMAVRNTGVHILQCKEVDPRGWIVPVERLAYFYDTIECVKVIDLGNLLGD